MKLNDIALRYARTCAEAEAILVASAPEVIPFLHKQDLQRLTKKIVSYNLHGLEINSIHVPRSGSGYIWPLKSNFYYAGKIFSLHIVVTDPKAEKPRAVPKNLSLVYIFDVHKKRLWTQVELLEHYRKEYDEWIKRCVSKINSASLPTEKASAGHSQENK